eukprot:668344-Hanusia_phi.AAC.5
MSQGLMRLLASAYDATPLHPHLHVSRSLALREPSSWQTHWMVAEEASPPLRSIMASIANVVVSSASPPRCRPSIASP